MRALVYTAPGRVEAQERPRPEAEAGEVLIGVAVTGICGSDVHGFLGHSARRKPGLVLGHEAVGSVAAVGDGVDKALIGKRVSVNPLISCGRCEACIAGRHNVCGNWRLLGMDTTPGAFAEAVVAPARNVTPLPDHVSDAEAVMIEPLANAVHLVAHAPVHAGLLPSAALFGAGTLGVAILVVAKARGYRIVAVVEPNAARAEVAKLLGAERVLNPLEVNAAEEIRKLTGGRGVDVALDAVGLEATRQGCADCLARGGTALFLGLDHGPTTFDFIDLIRREIRLQCSFAYDESDFAAAFDMVCRGSVNFTRWTDIMQLHEGQRAFERLIGERGNVVKIALKP